MEAIGKLQQIAQNMDLEPAEEVSITHQTAPCGIPVPTSKKQPAGLGVYPAALGNGQTLPMLKTMLTTACERNCYYCPFQAGRNYRRTNFQPEELAKTFMQMNHAGIVQGLFLSSGILKGGITTQDKLIDTVEILRHKHQFNGYIHLKIMPGVEKGQVERAMQLADRLSVNLEAPTRERLAQLAPKKEFIGELIQPLRWVEELRQTKSPQWAWKGRFPSTVTQFVVGAVGDSDLELLTTTNYLYRQLRLRRTYFSAFRPIENTPLENLPATPLMRQNRLYQASFLLRDYGFELESLPFDPTGSLPLDRDPKQVLAETTLLYQPVELNLASRQQLLQVPGIGVKHADTILAARRQGKIQDLQELRQLGIPTQRLQPYILLNGKRPWQQLKLW